MKKILCSILLFGSTIVTVFSQDLYQSVTYRKILRTGPALDCIGKLTCKSSSESNAQRWSVGCEGLDRDMAVFSKYGKYVGELGVAYARVQSGWNKTEKKKGCYDFAWLDKIVDGLNAQNVKPWICLCYGNALYSDTGFTLGNAIFTDEKVMKAWERYVEATVTRYKDKVWLWEVWNEPNISENKDHPQRYVNLLIRTCRAIHKVDPDAHIAAFSLASLDYPWLQRSLDELSLSGCKGLFDHVTLHKYFENPDEGDYDFALLKKLVHSYYPDVTVFQGESGCPSELGWAHALKFSEWTEYSQAKNILRRMACDFTLGQTCNIFTMVDLVYPDFRQSFGLLCTSLQGDVKYKKPSFYAVRNMVNILQDNVVPYKQDWDSDSTKEIKVVGLANREDGRKIGVMLYFCGDVPSSGLSFTDIMIRFKNLSLEKPVFVEPVSGRIYRLDRFHYSPNNPDRRYKLPIWDSPVFLMEESALHYTFVGNDGMDAFFSNEW